ncbi:hypothetical protein HYDPIDRAFT_34453 [Hydnomerulius pinastri MD-312]|uniref:Uncharacterized protein n=1 Tax=Hydnomerulius pinastri MD-312 TaxID=994086 RepID=A0A0C9VKD1_9AGAM|nr:hypothetical protein HYDPIDRAFT_34632 [Hydnomerulius pinastri MD-312]KIJ58145.1 hypothetical protein HYDPIDRAFT_34453 [Hydnomerulius pinastri MD-312]
MDTEFEQFCGDSVNVTEEPPTQSVEEVIYPYPTLISFLLNNWFWSRGSTKSKADRRELVDVLLNPSFKLDDIRGVNFDSLDTKVAEDKSSTWGGNGWAESTITIDIPTGEKATKASKQRRANETQTARRHGEIDPDAPEIPSIKYEIPHFRHRSLLAIIREVFESAPARKFHFHPFKLFYKPPNPAAPPQRVFENAYTADAFLKADQELQDSPPEEGCTLPRAIAGFMFWSDATHVAQFGQAKLWPIYAYFANQCKYERCRPTARAARCVAYLPALPDSITDFLRERGRNISAPLLAHIRRELFHGAWAAILDDDFITAYVHGIIVDCADGIRRRLYPRIFTYSADYPEKVLIATIRDMGGCPCPCCTISKENIGGLGTKMDEDIRRSQKRTDSDERQRKIGAARALIYKDGYVITSKHVEELLKDQSLVPTTNTFSLRLSWFKFDFFMMLVVDLLHEFELGVWKALLSHLIRMLYVVGPSAVHEFNRRFRQVAPFGRSTIRRFAHNVADLTKLAARDYEDILRCCIPCFEGLFSSPHNETILSLLYIMCYWHSLAKLRMHTDSTLKILDDVTILLGQHLHNFANNTCEDFETYETDREYQARARAPQVGGKRRKFFNLATSKLHALGDYSAQIQLFGTTDSFTTQTGELQHTVVKGWNDRTNRNNSVPQIINIEARETVHDRISTLLDRISADHDNSGDDGVDADVDADEAVSELGSHHHIAKDESGEKHYLSEWLCKRSADPAFKDFRQNLETHLLLRLRGLLTFDDGTQFSRKELNEVIIQFDRIFPHATARFNYTSYDVRREQDTINTNSQRCDIMVRAHEDSEDGSDPKRSRFWYARVLGVYHTKVFHGSQRKPQRMEFLHVRWFGQDPEWDSGPGALQLECIGYIPYSDTNEFGAAFGIVDPKHVVRACHLVPAFSLGLTTDLLPHSSARDCVQGDWINYYVMRDMMMRFLGLGVGHMNPPEFPTEEQDLLVIQEDTHLHLPPHLESSHDPGGDEDNNHPLSPRSESSVGLDEDPEFYSDKDDEDDEGFDVSAYDW